MAPSSRSPVDDLVDYAGFAAWLAATGSPETIMPSAASMPVKRASVGCRPRRAASRVDFRQTDLGARDGDARYWQPSATSKPAAECRAMNAATMGLAEVSTALWPHVNWAKAGVCRIR